MLWPRSHGTTTYEEGVAIKIRGMACMATRKFDLPKTLLGVLLWITLTGNFSYYALTTILSSLA